ncbi:DnaT-like ssDNA-binding protein [Spiribacter sp. 390]|uniref:DnaT-like ssDNA-binding protein n=1 Tax=Spiribacter pallidus TaxID=1987936 RepID=A0ABV3TF99_9GAMM
MAYGTTPGLTTYASERGITISGTAAELLALAHDYIESLDYIGQKTVDDQAEQWPRKNAYVDGVELDDSVVPQGMIDAEYQVAIAIDQGNSPFATVTPGIKAERVDVLSVEYQDGASNRSFDPMVRLKLRKYLAGSSASTNIVTVSRG